MALRILLADDHEIVRRGLRALLEKHEGWEVCGEASDGREAVEKALQLKPDVVIVDIGMPNLDGYEVAKTIRATPWGRNILLVAVTGWGKEEDRRRAFEMGFDHHLTKPACAEDIEGILTKHQ